MAHAFRKYLNKRGSALFMVLSLMTALMILVMAMYFSVVSSREVQYKVFYQEQAYRSASSLSDAIVAGLSNSSWKTATGSDTLLTAITGLNEGETITTDGNGFAAFGGTNEEQDQLGAYTVSVTRMADEVFDDKTTYVYDIAITTSSGGVLDTTHTYIHVQKPEGEAQEGKTNIFTSTGYVPNDVFLDGGAFYTDVFFDNENAIIGAYSQMQLKIYGNVSAGGSLKMNYIDGTSGTGTEDFPPQASTWAIRNNFTHSASQGLNLGTSSERGLLLVGGDATFSGGLPDNVDIYVLGDAYFTANSSLSGNNVRLFVYGNIVLDGSASWCYMPSVTYASGHINNTGSGMSESFPKWKDNTSLPADVMSSHDMAMKLDSLTASNDYPKWDINDDAPAKDGYIPELDPSNSEYNPVTIKFNNDSSNASGSTPAMTYTQYLDWEDGHTVKDYYGKGKDLNYTACVIQDVVNAEGTNNSANRLTLVIDTGDDPNNQYIIKVTKNRDFDADGTNESFSWYPYNTHTSAVEMAVLVRGKGSVVVDVPEGVIYQDMDNVLFMHETWFAILGGKIEQKGATANSIVYDGGGTVISGNAAQNAVKFIHKCDDDCTTCHYTETTGDKCENCNDGTKIITITCDEHGGTVSYCPKCEASYEPEKNASGEYYGICANRVEPSVVRAKVNELKTTNPLMYSTLVAAGDGTDWYMPNNNIFLVSCEESADIRLSTTIGGETIMQNGFFGFIYAPYMTFKAYGNNAGGGYVRFCGGMIVSDYILRDSMSFLTCYPDQLPENLMSETDRNSVLDPLASKSWKISLAGY